MDNKSQLSRETAEYNPKAAAWPLKFKFRVNAWNIINATIFRVTPFFCYGIRRFLLRMFGACIAKGVTISRTARIEVPWNLSIGENSMIGKNAWVLCSGKVTIGKNVSISENVTILAGSHASNSTDYKPVMAPIEIGDNCWIATGAMVAAGGTRRLKIGSGAIVGAGAVVFTNVKAMTIVIGNPAEYLTDRVLVES